MTHHLVQEPLLDITHEQMRVAVSQNYAWQVAAEATPLLSGHSGTTFHINLKPVGRTGRQLSDVLSRGGPVEIKLDSNIFFNEKEVISEWHALVKAPNDSDYTSRVIVKIAQPSVEAISAVRSPPQWRLTSEEQFYIRAYRHQGTHIPYCFGTHVVPLPWTEPGMLLVLEDVPGVPLSNFEPRETHTSTADGLAEDAHKQQTSLLFRSCFDGLTAIHKLGTVHGIVDEQNMIIILDPTPCVVFINAPGWLPSYQWGFDYSVDRENAYSSMAKYFPCCFNDDPNSPVPSWEEAMELMYSFATPHKELNWIEVPEDVIPPLDERSSNED